MRRLFMATLLVATAVLVVSAPQQGVVSAVSRIDCTPPTGAAAPATASGGFIGRNPERLVDTRAATPVPENCWLRTALPANVPADATAVAVTVTSDRVARPGYLTVHPCGSALPELSNLNVRVEGPNSNFAIIGVDATREICVYSSGGTDVIVDLVGHFGPGGSKFQEFEPRRALDTRSPDTRPADVPSPVPPRQVITMDRARLGIPVEATAVMVNLTVTRALGSGFLTAYPCAGTRPATSNVNYVQNVDRANTSIVALSAAATICIELDVSAGDVIVDVVGWLGGDVGLDYRVGMSRVADSRNGVGGWSQPFQPNETRAFNPAITGVMPNGTRVAVFGVVATRALDAGFLQVRPCGNTADVSSVNYSPSVDITNLVAVPLTDDGTICVTSSGRTDVVVDMFGGFGADGLMRSLSVSGPETFPVFRPDVHDYVAYCPSTTGNQFTVSARSMPGTQVQLVGGPTGTPRLATALTRDADDAITLVVTPTSGPAEEYWIRCLPPDFPRVSVTRPGDPEPGWYLLNNGSQNARFGIIVDTNGVPVWYRRGLAGREPRGLQRLSDGSLTWFQAAGFAFGIATANRFERFELDGTLLAEYGVAPPNATNHHELLPLPNGNFLLTSMPRQPAPANTTCTTPTGVSTTATEVAGARVEEVDAQGNPAPGGFVWDAEVLAPTAPDRVTLVESTVRLCFVTQQGDRILSAVHPNALDVRGDHVLVSARHADAIYAINRLTGEIDWKLGGTDRPGVSLTIGGQSPLRPARQHDVEVLPNGNVTLFDNRTPFAFATGPAVSGPARFVEYQIDEGSMTANIVRQLERPNGDNSGALGSARVQPDGAIVINWGAVPGPTFTEFDDDGAVLLEVSFTSPDVPQYSYRTIKEPIGSFDLAELRATAGR